jgi:predicted nucleic acid-binding protein
MPEINSNDVPNSAEKSCTLITNSNNEELDTNEVFIDTNILIYANLTASPFHKYAIQILETLYQQGSTLWISRQILREYLSAMTRKDVLTAEISITSLIKDILRTGTT